MEFTPITGTALQSIARALEHPVGKAEIAALSFYENGDFLGVDGKAYIAAGDGPITAANLFALTGESDPIHEANAVAGLSITDDTVIEYLAFFNMFIAAEDGVFTVCLGGPFDGRMIEAPMVRKDSGDFRIECFVYYAERLFKCEYKVTMSGDVEMIYGDQVEVDDLPAVH